MLIYKITNIINNKIYIGKTRQSIKTRWNQHCYNAFHNSKYHFHRAMKKYGKENFKIEIVEEVNNKDYLNEREVYWINYYNTFHDVYNSTTGGEKGFEHTEETLKKISIASKNNIKAKRRGKDNPLYGRKRPEYISEIISKTHKNKLVSIETKRKMREAKLGKPSPRKGVVLSETIKENMRLAALNRKKF